MTVSPTQRIGVVVTLVIVLALGGAVALILANFSKTLEETVEARFRFLSQDVRDSIETGLNLGLALPELTNVQDIIDSRVTRDPALLRIAVVGGDGAALFVTERGPDATAAQAPDGAFERVRVPLQNSFGRTVGAVELDYAVGVHEATIARVRGSLLRVAVALAVAGAALGLLASMLLLRPVPRRLARIRRWFESGEVDDTPADDLERAAAEAVRTSAQVLRELDGTDPKRRRAGESSA